MAKVDSLTAAGKSVPIIVSDLPAELCCSVGDVLARLGDKWSVLVIHMLARGIMRFSELERSIGSISKRMLATTLRSLERDGYVERTVTPTTPPRVHYTLTGLGRNALTPVAALAHWALAHRTQVEAARKHFDVKQSTTT